MQMQMQKQSLQSTSHSHHGFKEVMESTEHSNNEAIIQISRPAYTNATFNQSFPPKPSDKSTPSKYIQRFFQQQRCDSESVKTAVYSLVPSLKWIPKYDIRQFILGDVIAGLTVGVVNIPQGMAFSMLAALAPVYGLYVSFFPVLVYFFLGTSRHLSIGTFAVVSIMSGNAVDRIIMTIDVPRTAPPMTTESSNSLSPMMNTSVVDRDISEYLEAEKIKIHTALCLLVGIMQLLMGICRLGFVSVYLSDSLTRAFTCGAAFHVITSQIKYFFGLTIDKYQGFFSLIYTWRDLFLALPRTNLAEFVIAVIAMTVLAIVKYLSAKYQHKIKFPIPIELIIVIVATMASFFGNLPSKFGVDPVGHIPVGFPRPTLPPVNYFSQLVQEAFGISIVGFAVSISLAKILASKNNYIVSSNQELLAYGSANVLSSFFSCFVSAGSLARSVLQDGVGGKTQFASLIQCSMVLVVVLWLGPLLEPLPKVILAVMIVYALKNMIIQAADLHTLWKQSKYDWLIWLVTVWAVVLLGVDTGLFVGVGFSFLTVVLRTQLPHYVLSSNVTGTEVYRNIQMYPNAENSSGTIKVFQMQSSLYFANVRRFRTILYQMSGVHPTQFRYQMEADSMKAKRKELRNRKAKQSQLENNAQVDISDDVCIVNNTYDISLSEGDGTPVTSPSVPQHGLEAIVIDCSAFNFIDLMAVKTLLGLVEEYEKIGIRVVLAQCQDSVLKTLDHGGFFKKVGQDLIYLTVHDAVVSLSNNANQVTDDVIEVPPPQHRVHEQDPEESQM